MSIRGMALSVVCLVVAGCDPSEGAGDPAGPGGKADTVFADKPLQLTGAFDGSQKFQMWVDTLEFARQLERDFGKRLGFTYFINTCYFDKSVTGSAIGTAVNDQELAARWAITQQAINEGHEIASHTVRHLDGGAWSEGMWQTEFREFHDLVEKHLFVPVRDAGGAPVFPRWRAMPGAAAGEVGATCAAASDCASSLCIPVTPTQSFCSAECNKNQPCGNGTGCGAPTWNQDVDYCLPVPEFPIEHDGKVLFDAAGRANLAHPALTPYRMKGFRAPQLAHNTALFEVMLEFDFVYDTSKIIAPGPPFRVKHDGRVFDSIYEFALMKNPGSLSVPMDFNYKVNNGTGERMLADYKASIVASYNDRKRIPWNIGHHFALWNDGAYWQAMKGAFVYAAGGCQEGGVKRCEQVAFPTFAELATSLDAAIGKNDGFDLFVDEDASEGELDEAPAECPCDQAH